MQERAVNLRAVFSTLAGSNVLLLPDAPTFTIVAVSRDYLLVTDRNEEDLVGNGLFSVFPNNPQDAFHTSEKTVRASLEYVLAHKEPHHLPVQRYDVLMKDGRYIERYWSAHNNPVLNEEGEVVYLIHSAVDVTHNLKLKMEEEKMKGIHTAYELFMNAPVIIGILRGEDYTIELANEGLLEVWGRSADVIGKPLFTAIPELANQGFRDLLDKVLMTGEPFYAYEFPILLNRNGKEELLYFDFVYNAIYDSQAGVKASGIISVGHEVTQQVTSRQKREESEAKYRSLFATMDQGFCVLELLFNDKGEPVDYRFEETNPVFEKQTGLTQAIGKTAKELVPGLEQHWIERYGRVAATGEPIRFTEGSTAMGRFFDVYAYRVSERDRSRVALLFTDITEKWRTEEALRESEERFRSMADQAPMIVYLVEPNEKATISYFNKTWLEYTGQSFDEALVRTWQGIVHPEDLPILEKVNFTAFQNRQAFSLPAVRLKRYDGVYRWHLFKSTPRYLAGGAFIGFIGIGLDIHEQKLSEDALTQSEARARLAIASANMGTFELDVAAQSIIHSPRTAEIVGLNPAVQWPYQSIVETVHPEDRSIREKAHEEARITGKLFYEARVILPDQSIRWVRLNGRLLHHDNIPLMIGTIMDITDEKKAAEMLEQKVQERTRELKQVNDQLKQFTYAASHDLQEPLRKISYFLDHLMAKLAPTLTEDTKKIADRIQHTTGRMRSLIDDLLAYSNTTLGVTGFEEVDLAVIVADVLSDMEATLIEKKVTLNIAELPVVKGDPRQLRQLFQNLIGNALKYHKKGESPMVEISFRSVPGAAIEAPIGQVNTEKTFYEIAVRDNGIGFDPDDAERIFRLFQRLHGKSEYEGTGVGLAIVEKVAENHHGYVWAESSPGEGATFRVLLPKEAF